MTSQTSFSIAGDIRLLAVDTSTVQGSLALCWNHGQVQARSWDKKSTHSERATIETKNILESCHLTFKDLTHLSVNVGPGSFTGLRVGLNLTKTLAYALSLPVITFNTLELLAFKHATENKQIFVAMKAIQNFYYAAGYTITSDGPQILFSPQSIRKDDVAEISKSYSKVLIEGEGTLPWSGTNAQDQLEYLRKWPQLIRFFSWNEVHPLYIRASEAEEKMRQGLLRPL